ncbi:MAG TPA: hypothetical protein VGA09_12490 [Candidatus Binatia bacterium]
MRKNFPFAFAIKTSAKPGVGSTYFSKTKRLSVLAEEFNSTARFGLAGAAFSRGGTCQAVQEKIPLVKNPRERNSRLNKADKTNNVFFARNIKVMKDLFTLALGDTISSDTPLGEF